MSLSTSAEAQVFVDIGLQGTASPGLNNGADWPNAYHSLDSAFLDADIQNGLQNQIWVAKGYYEPSTAGLTDPREASFLIPNGVKLYGGFVNGTGSIGARFPGDFQRTVLTGKQLSGNTYNVVTAQAGPGFVTLDGFLVEGGVAKGSSGSLTDDPTRNGGGLFARGTHLKLENCFFESNIAKEAGGAVYFSGGDSDRFLYIFECEFSTNTASLRGGGLYMELFKGVQGEGSPSTHVYNTKFRRNLAGTATGPGQAFTLEQGGGAIAIGPRSQTAHAAFCNNLFIQNLVNGWGSAVWHSTHLGTTASMNGQFTWSHCTFTTNVIISSPLDPSGPIANYYPSGTYMTDGVGTMSNSIFWDNSHDGQFPRYPDGILSLTPGWSQEHCDVQLRWTGPPVFGEGNIATNPLFENPTMLDYSLSSSSPCLDKGSDDLIPSDYPDADGNGNWTETVFYEFDVSRIRSYDQIAGQNCWPSALTCGEADMGAFERQP